jgi:4-amino-4-deoxy-L-arabinose transferase-like glycosyltransferase
MSKSGFLLRLGKFKLLTNPEQLYTAGLLVAALILFCTNLGGQTLRDWDEATYAIAARGMYRTGDWLHPMLFDKPYLNKPPLGLWLIASSYSVLGISEMSTRLPLAFVSALGVPLLYQVGRQIFNQHLPALFSALVFLTWLPVVRHGRLAMLDGLAVTCFLLLLLCLLRSRKQSLWLVGVGICLGLLTLTKGILAFLLAGLAALFWLAEGQFATFWHPYLWLGLILGYSPVVYWYLAQGLYYGPDFWQTHFLKQAISRSWDAVDRNTGPIWYYLQVVLLSAWPWLLFLPQGLAKAWQSRRTWGKLVLIGAIGFLVVISMMKTKLPWYVMPIYPFLAIAIGNQLARDWLQGNRHLSQHSGRTYPRSLGIIFGIGAVLTLVGAGIVVWQGSPAIVLGLGIAIAMTLGWAAFYLIRSHRNFIPVLFLGCYLTLALFFQSPVWVWELNEAYPVKPVAQLLQTHTPPGTVLYTTFAYRRPSLDFYSDRRVVALTPQQLSQIWSKHPYALVDQTTLKSLNPATYQRLGTSEDLTLVLGQ